MSTHFDESNEDFFHFSSLATRTCYRVENPPRPWDEKQPTPAEENDKRRRARRGEIPALLSLESPGAACAGFFWISHRLNCKIPRHPPALAARFEECLANGWQLVPSRAQYREPLGQLFARATSSSRTGNRRCHCYTGRSNGASRFRAIPPLYIHPARSLDSRPPPPSRFPFRHLSTPPVISSRRYLNTVHIRTMPGRGSFSTTAVAVDAALCRCCCYPVASNSIRRCDLARGKKRWTRGKKTRPRYSSRTS